MLYAVQAFIHMQKAVEEHSVCSSQLSLSLEMQQLPIDSLLWWCSGISGVFAVLPRSFSAIIIRDSQFETAWNCLTLSLIIYLPLYSALLTEPQSFGLSPTCQLEKHFAYINALKYTRIISLTGALVMKMFSRHRKCPFALHIPRREKCSIWPLLSILTESPPDIVNASFPQMPIRPCANWVSFRQYKRPQGVIKTSPKEVNNNLASSCTQTSATLYPSNASIPLEFFDLENKRKVNLKIWTVIIVIKWCIFKIFIALVFFLGFFALFLQSVLKRYCLWRRTTRRITISSPLLLRGFWKV